MISIENQGNILAEVRELLFFPSRPYRCYSHQEEASCLNKHQVWMHSRLSILGFKPSSILRPFSVFHYGTLISMFHDIMAPLHSTLSTEMNSDEFYSFFSSNESSYNCKQSTFCKLYLLKFSAKVMNQHASPGKH